MVPPRHLSLFVSSFIYETLGLDLNIDIAWIAEPIQNGGGEASPAGSGSATPLSNQVEQLKINIPQPPSMIGSREKEKSAFQ